MMVFVQLFLLFSIFKPFLVRSIPDFFGYNRLMLTICNNDFAFVLLQNGMIPEKLKAIAQKYGLLIESCSARVGEGFENKTVYLPQLLMSAEAAQGAFETIKTHMAGSGKTKSRGVFVLATVRGDIHDIGKNIVKLLLENYGFEVVDLGKDVQPEIIAEKVVELHAPIAGLSALMTTTVPAMEETIRLLKVRAPWCKTVVGGAVLTQEYADRIGADKYAKDAMETVRYAETVISQTAD